MIVKLANIVLTPSDPKYDGGVWHVRAFFLFLFLRMFCVPRNFPRAALQVEGMNNEAIVASGIYYYHSENISKSVLAFRMAVGEPGQTTA